jgi:hypothetical protein
MKREGRAGVTEQLTIEQIKKLLEGVTPGEWKVDWHELNRPPTVFGISTESMGDVVSAYEDYGSAYLECKNEDGKLIAAAPQIARQYIKLYEDRQRYIDLCNHLKGENERLFEANETLIHEQMDLMEKIEKCGGILNMIPKYCTTISIILLSNETIILNLCYDGEIFEKVAIDIKHARSLKEGLELVLNVQE